MSSEALATCKPPLQVQVSPGPPADWREVVLSDVAHVNPETLRASTSPDFSFGYIDISQIDGPGQCAGWAEQTFGEAPSRARRKVRAGDILVSTVRPYLRSFAQVPKADLPLVASTGFAVVRAGAEADQQFLFQHILHDSFIEHLTPRMTGSNYPAVSASDVEAYPISLPPLDEQRRIANVLRSVDEAIAAADAVIIGLESAASEIAKRAFTDPDNVELEHEIVTFGDLFDIKGGNQPPKSSFIYQPKDGYVRLLQIRDFESDDKAAYISEKSSNVRCGKDDILIARYGASVGRILTGKAGAYNVALTKIVLRDRNILRRYAYHWLKSDYFQDRIIAVSNRSAQAGFNKEDLFPTKIALPPLAKQADIAEALDDMEKAVGANRSESRQMNEVKGALLADLLSGHVRVPA